MLVKKEIGIISIEEGQKVKDVEYEKIYIFLIGELSSV
jgi:hypothetical protein